MGILIAVALVGAVLWGIAAMIKVGVAMTGGEPPETPMLRRVSEIGRAKLATVRLDQEYHDLLVRGAGRRSPGEAQD